MSVLMNLTIFPTDKGESVGEYVSAVIEYIRASGASYQLTSMGTVIETETMNEALAIVQGAYNILEPNADRVYCGLTMDVRKGKSNRIKKKIESVEQRIGEISK